MSRPTEFQTSDIDISAEIMTATGRQLEKFQQPGRALTTFEFPDDEITRITIIDYATGELPQPAKRFAARRALCRQAKAVKSCL